MMWLLQGYIFFALVFDQDPAGLADDHATSIVAAADRPIPRPSYPHVGVVNDVGGLDADPLEIGHCESIHS